MGFHKLTSMDEGQLSHRSDSSSLVPVLDAQSRKLRRLDPGRCLVNVGIAPDWVRTGDAVARVCRTSSGCGERRQKTEHDDNESAFANCLQNRINPRSQRVQEERLSQKREARTPGLGLTVGAASIRTAHAPLRGEPPPCNVRHDASADTSAAKASIGTMCNVARLSCVKSRANSAKDVKK